MDTLERLRAGDAGGTIALEIPDDISNEVDRVYRRAIRNLKQFQFWSGGDIADYRPRRGLWLPQRRAVAFLHAYLSACAVQGSAREAALVKMPTGTGKTAVIAALACASPLVRRTLILTPRAGLVDQMRLDLSFRFWAKLGAVYHGCRLHEKLDADTIAKLTKRIQRGALAPVRALGAKQYGRIWAERGQERQILVSTFNALHLVLGLEPPAHRSMYGRNARDVAASLSALGDVEAFRAMLRSVDLVIVDEGHYEPAYSWSQAVRAIPKPTIIFSATPYRNDYKYFNIDGHFVFNLPWQEAVDQRLIRDVRFAPPIAAPASAPARRGRYDEASFAAEFATTVAALPKGKKAIVHAGTYRSLTELQRAFLAHGTAAVLIHDAVAKDEKKGLDGLDKKDSDRLGALRFEHVRKAEESKAAQAAPIWLHQYKLLEGIDDDRFVEIWLYDGFGSARQVIQQIGRAIRRPDWDDPHGQVATIRGSGKRLDVYEGAPTVAEQVESRWADYRRYETYVAESVQEAFIAETQLLARVKRAAPAVQYIGGEFREGHLLDQSPTMAAFMLPRRAVVCRVRDAHKDKQGAIPDQFLDSLESDAMEAMLLEERFDIKSVAAADGDVYRDVRLIRYLAWGNSPYLVRHHIPEWRLGVMAMARAGGYIFILDTEGVCIDYSRVGLFNPASVEFKRLFPEEDEEENAAGGAMPARRRTRIVETAATGLDISELGLRSISVRRHALDESYFDLAEASQVPSSVQGYGRLGEDTARRRLSLSRSSVADVTNRLLAVKDYVAWSKLIAGTMADESIQPHAYFNRFAQEEPPPDTEGGAPQSILLDLWDLLDVADETTAERQWDRGAAETILAYDNCCEVVQTADRKGRPLRCFTFGDYSLELKYAYRDSVPPGGRYQILGPELNEAVARRDEAAEDAGENEVDDDENPIGQRLPASLTRLINQEQAFQIVPAKRGVVYSHGHFYKPQIDDAVLTVLEKVDELAGVISEKGNTRLKSISAWDGSTLFGLVYGWVRKRPYGDDNKFAADLASCETLICDDRGKETADFYGIDDARRRVLVVHAKADDATPGISARKLQEVARQAQTSLAFAGSSRREFPLPAEWRQPWSVPLRDAGGATITQDRLIAAKGVTVDEAHERLIDALADPSYVKDVIMLTSGILSQAAAEAALESDSQRDLQFLYFLASVRSTFDRAGIRFRIICNP